MKKILWKKYLVIGVVLLFIHIEFIPMISSSITKNPFANWTSNNKMNMVEQQSKTSEQQGIFKKPINETVVLAPDSTYFATTAFDIYKKYRVSNGQTIICESLETLVHPNADQVRDFLKKDYLDGKRRYLLILGDEDLIPCKYCFDFTYPGYPSFPVYSDYYYGDLNGDWDSNHNGLFGEFRRDKVDFLDPEFLVGRLPGSTVAEIGTMLNRTVTFEEDKDIWKYNMLLAAGTVFISGDSSIVMNLIDWFSTPYCYNVTTMSDAWIVQKPDIVLNETSFRTTWFKGSYGLVYVMSHGWHTALSYYRGPYDYPEFFDMWDVPFLNPDYPSVFVSLGCLTNRQYVGKTLGKELILNRMVAVVASTTATYMNPIPAIWGETSFPRMYLRRAQNLGMAIQTTKAMYYNLFTHGRIFFKNGNYLQINLLAFMLYGDPLIRQC